MQVEIPQGTPLTQELETRVYYFTVAFEVCRICVVLVYRHYTD